VKIHGARVTETLLHYEGSITLDEELMEKAGILPGEELQILNLNNGARFTTYAIPGKKDSGIVCLNGPAARLAEVGDKILILGYALLTEKEIETHKTRYIFLDEKNRIVKIQE